MAEISLEFTSNLEQATSSPGGLLLSDSIPRPAVSGVPQAGDTNGNPDLGRRRPASLLRHFPNAPERQSGQLCKNYWDFIQKTLEEWAEKAPRLTEICLEGTSIPPGLTSPLCPNLTGIVQDPNGPQAEIIGTARFPKPNSAADTAGPHGTINPARDPKQTSSSRVSRAFIEGRKVRWSEG